MSLRIVISCDGTWNNAPGCRAHYATRAETFEGARVEAVKNGWGVGGPLTSDLCPTHVRLLTQVSAPA